MTPAGPVRIGDGPECPNCASTAWDIGMVGTIEGGTLDLAPAPMARCARCGLSARLDADRIVWEK